MDTIAENKQTVSAFITALFTGGDLTAADTYLPCLHLEDADAGFSDQDLAMVRTWFHTLPKGSVGRWFAKRP